MVSVRHLGMEQWDWLSIEISPRVARVIEAINGVWDFAGPPDANGNPSNKIIEPAIKTLLSLDRCWQDIFQNEKDKVDTFPEKVIRVIWVENITSATELDELLKEYKGVAEEYDRVQVLQLSRISCAHVCQAIKNINGPNHPDAWIEFGEGAFWAGAAIGAMAIIEKSLASMNDFSRLGAVARHAENHAMKADVFKWLDQNMHKHGSADSAAEAIFGKVVPVTFRTAQLWVSQWKKLRSTGTPHTLPADHTAAR